ncbi:hypothetical protein LEP1GSC079_4109 [Leptospira interrogans str. FPW1039]|uniref:Uncharacterized protein n=1 Tax=Leptospira interrogans str. FPW1039 TaxID=1193040 RepID=A0A0F6I9A9_LEPIR|nr:hypothetical protein LEP1GSC069_0125 [Leptospira interrogans serovar Canicola str. Fiocruz LV133]EMF33551.1 hypothetical protein LEP1GSC201_0726 [Leptospira interrogans serovar Pomona str. Fox 32256]EMI71171.1 hypothetical protein LEP1GSC200_3562 [Leptospira interrogans serovar Pomona str. CSL10083]EMJ34634.1 hypothetical protein LEP1GSC079_4109 [Leptospira interrogans str. FPW1039]EMK21029.1 hypothetical protein LEP1GSC075_2784 [Leptospira interrogans str. Kito]EMN74505.1 hypothetical prot
MKYKAFMASELVTNYSSKKIINCNFRSGFEPKKTGKK